MFAAVRQNIIDHLSPKGFAFTTRDKNGNLLKKPIPLTRQETLGRLSEINSSIGKMRLIADKALAESNAIEPNSDCGCQLARKCSIALEHCAKISEQNDFFYSSIHTSEDPMMMDRKHARYANQLDEIATSLSSIVKRICKD